MVSWTYGAAGDVDNIMATYEAATTAGTDDAPTCTFTLADYSGTAITSGQEFTTSFDLDAPTADGECGYSVFLFANDGVATAVEAEVVFSVSTNNAVVVSVASFLIAASLLF